MRMENYFYEQSERDGSLLEYAACNIAEEILSEEYRLWHTKDEHGYFVFLIICKEDHSFEEPLTEESQQGEADSLSHLYNPPLLIHLLGPHFHSTKQLRSWTTNMIQKIQEYGSTHLEEASLQSIAPHVFLNPSYLSKMYRLETGEGISDYL